MALALHKRPSEIIRLQGSEVWLFEVDYQLLRVELELTATGKEETDDEKKTKMKNWKWKKRSV